MLTDWLINVLNKKAYMTSDNNISRAMNIEQVREFALSLYGVTEDQPFGDDNITFRIEEKIFMCLWLGEDVDTTGDRSRKFACKLPPGRNEELRERYETIVPAFHWNKKHWSDIYFEKLEPCVVTALIIESYNLIISKLPKASRGKYEKKSNNRNYNMKAYTYIEKGKFAFVEKQIPEIQEATDAIVRVTLGSICTSDLHIKHGSVPRAVPGITVGHEMVGIVEAIGSKVKGVKVGDRVTVNVETFCGECFYCKHGYVNNCTSPHGGWALGCRIDGGQTEYVRVPLATQGLNRIPDSVSDEQALFVGDVLATGYWAARISEITEEDTVLIIGAGPTGICTLLSVMLKQPKRIIVCEQAEERRTFVREHYPEVLLTTPEECIEFVKKNSDHGGADRVLEVAGGKTTFQLAWQCARPNAIVTIVALYDEPQLLPLPDMYGKNLTFKTGGVDGCDCKEILRLIDQGKIDTTPLITHRFPLSRIEEAYRIFENKKDGVIKIAIYNG